MLNKYRKFNIYLRKYKKNNDFSIDSVIKQIPGKQRRTRLISKLYKEISEKNIRKKILYIKVNAKIKEWYKMTNRYRKFNILERKSKKENKREENDLLNLFKPFMKVNVFNNKKERKLVLDKLKFKYELFPYDTYNTTLKKIREERYNKEMMKQKLKKSIKEFKNSKDTMKSFIIS